MLRFSRCGHCPQASRRCWLCTMRWRRWTRCDVCLDAYLTSRCVPAVPHCSWDGARRSSLARVCCAVLCCAVLCCAVLCCAVLCCAVLCCAVLCCAVLCCAVLCCAVLCCVVLCCVMLCCAVLCCGVVLLWCLCLRTRVSQAEEVERIKVELGVPKQFCRGGRNAGRALGPAQQCHAYCMRMRLRWGRQLPTVGVQAVCVLRGGGGGSGVCMG
jgi:hypothetical protein